MANFFKRSTHKFRLTCILVLIIMLVSSLGYTTYAWIQRQWSPYIAQDGNIAVETSGSIVFQLQKGGTATSTTITDYYGVSNFELKPVSSLTGEKNTFFKLSLSDDDNDESFASPKYTALVNPEGSTEYDSDFAVRNGYIDISLYLMATASVGSEIKQNDIYFDPESIITSFDPEDHSGASHTIRVAITVDNTTTYLFRENQNPEVIDFATGRQIVEEHKAVINTKVGDKFVADGEYYYSDPVNEIVDERFIGTNNSVRSLDDFKLTVDENGKKIGNNSPLFSIFRNRVRLDIRIWSEGSDEYCTEQIIGKQLKLLLKFVAYTPDKEGN